MSHLAPPMAAALASGRATVTLFVEVDFPGGVGVRLLAGSGEIPWSGSTFLGRDPQFGTLAAIQPGDDGVGDTAPSLSFTLIPPSDSAAASLAAPSMQGSPMRLWVAAIDDNGAVIDSPDLQFDGLIDVPVISIDQGGKRQLDYDVVSEMDRFFQNEEGRRLSGASHRQIWPDEGGLDYVSGIIKDVIWGPGTKPSGIVYGSSIGGGIGGGGGGGFALGFASTVEDHLSMAKYL